ncbi:hypothetical protein LQV63_19960 [Paenibacillus profundus]|uniref:Uncharacterized protein n=1 Tax=Paenibacillus profundus TaxID=1173085 RepID=A0ABS8YIE4_9BACL|nr:MULTISPECIES: hypothetical protein [Paenibacillus]MCE5171581.1 hypothetical protein [Paenibacillus profundus]
MVPVPLDERTIQHHCGRTVYVETQDGQRYIGRLSSCRRGKLVLNADATSAAKQQSLAPAKRKKKGSRQNTPSAATSEKTAPKAHTNAVVPYGTYYPYPCAPYNYGPRVDLDLAVVTLLLLLFI